MKKPTHEDDVSCNEQDCQICCPHDEFDHYICLDCGYEKDPGEDIDAAMDYLDND